VYLFPAVANDALFVQKKLWLRIGVSCRSGVSATSFKDVIDFLHFERRYADALISRSRPRLNRNPATLTVSLLAPRIARNRFAFLRTLRGIRYITSFQ